MDLISSLLEVDMDVRLNRTCDDTMIQSKTQYAQDMHKNDDQKCSNLTAPNIQNQYEDMDLISSLLQVDMDVRANRQDQRMMTDRFEKHGDNFPHNVDRDNHDDMDLISSLIEVDMDVRSNRTYDNKMIQTKTLEAQVMHMMVDLKHSGSSVPNIQNQYEDMNIISSLLEVDMDVSKHPSMGYTNIGTIHTNCPYTPPSYPDKLQDQYPSTISCTNTRTQDLSLMRTSLVGNSSSCVQLKNMSYPERKRNIFSAYEKRHARSMCSLPFGDIDNDDDTVQTTNFFRASSMEDKRIIENRRMNYDAINPTQKALPPETSSRRRNIFSVKEKNSAMERAKYIW